MFLLADGRTPLHLAALGGFPEVIAFLLTKRAWIDAEDARDNTPLHLAARSLPRAGGVYARCAGPRAGNSSKHAC